jgi:hypothetical protein
MRPDLAVPERGAGVVCRQQIAAQLQCQSALAAPGSRRSDVMDATDARRMDQMPGGCG